MRAIHHLLKRLPSERHLRGSRLHRLLGERLFARELWRPTRQGVLGGAALGVFIGMTPTMGVQAILAGLAAIGIRVNVPMTIMATLISNPLSAPFIYTLEYRLGLVLLGPPDHADLTGYPGAMRRFLNYAEPLWAGSLVAGAFLACVVYLVLSLIWKNPGADGEDEMPTISEDV